MPQRRRLTARAGDVRLAIDTGLIDEVAPMPIISPLPRGPAPALGVAVFRGETLPVVDAARLLGRGASAPDRCLFLLAPRVAVAVEATEGFEDAASPEACEVEIDQVRRPLDLGRLLGECFEEAWRKAGVRRS